MAKKGQSTKGLNWTAIAAVGAVVAAIIPAWQFLQSSGARVETKRLIAQSPDLMSDYDRAYNQQHNLSYHLVETPYWKSRATGFDPRQRRGFLFAMIVNYGPGSAYNIQLSSVEWTPGAGTSPPYAIDIGGTLGSLDPGNYFAILLDVLDPKDPQQQWSLANFDLSDAGFTSILFHVTFQDRIGFSHTTQFALGQNPQWPTSYPTSGAPDFKFGSQ